MGQINTVALSLKSLDTPLAQVKVRFRKMGEELPDWCYEAELRNECKLIIDN